jgi:hypothetical protein
VNVGCRSGLVVSGRGRFGECESGRSDPPPTVRGRNFYAEGDNLVR